jgi:hypothetical protein
MKLPEYIATTFSRDWFISYDSFPHLKSGWRVEIDHDIPSLDDLFKKLKDKDFLYFNYNTSLSKERDLFLHLLEERSDLTEIHKRLLLMYKKQNCIR